MSRVHSAYQFSDNFDPIEHKTATAITGLIDECNFHGEAAAESAPMKHIHNNNKRCPRFYHQRTNIAESIANLFLSNGFRHEIPPASVPYFFSAYNNMVNTAMKELEDTRLLSYSGIGRSLAAESQKMDQGERCNKFSMTISNTDKNGSRDDLDSDHPIDIDTYSEKPFLHSKQGATCNTLLSTNNLRSIKSPESTTGLVPSCRVTPLTNIPEPHTPSKDTNNYQLEIRVTPQKRKKSTPSANTVVTSRSRKNIELSTSSTHRKIQPVTPMTQMAKGGVFFDCFFQPLTEEEECIYNNAFENIQNCDKVCTYGDIKIIGKDLKTLSPGTWLNDTVIDLFFSLLDHQQELLYKDSKRTNCLFMRTAFMHFLMSEGYTYSRVQRWTNNVDIFSFSKIFIPVNVTGTHWFCMVVFMEEQRIEVFDSLQGTYLDHLVVVFRYLSDEHQRRKGKALEGKWKLFTFSERNIFMQFNGHDCGVYTCMNTHYHSLVCPDKSMTKQSSTVF